MMKVYSAKFCMDCDELLPESKDKCSACLSTYLLPLSYFVPRKDDNLEEIADASSVVEMKDPWWWRLPIIGRLFRPVTMDY